MPGLLKVKVQTVRVAEKPEVLKDQSQVGQRPNKVDQKLQDDRLALEREEARNKLMEQTAIHDYTTLGGTVCFREINGWLRNPKGKLLHADVVKKKVALIKSGLAKLPDHQGEVYRGTHLTKEQLEAYSVGKKLVEAAFTSTSCSIGVGQSYATHGDRVPVLFVIESKHGKSIVDYSAFPAEQEVLFTAGTAFEVTGRSVDAKGRHVVHMRDVDEQQNA
jgi:NAD:arginine ADP-ribosyltransferase